MGTETRVEIVSSPVVGPGQKMVHGRIVGPTDEEYPKGTGGPLPRAENLLYRTYVVTTTRDTNSGHTVPKQTLLENYDTSELDETELAAFNRAAAKAKTVPGKRFLAGRPTLENATPTPVTAGRGAQAQEPAAAITPETQVQMDAHYYRLSDKDKATFREEYPAYVPGPAPASEGTHGAVDAVTLQNSPGAEAGRRTGPVDNEEVETETQTEPESPAQQLADVQAANARRVKADQAKVGK